jgi:hypothetical protein
MHSTAQRLEDRLKSRTILQFNKCMFALIYFFLLCHYFYNLCEILSQTKAHDFQQTF